MGITALASESKEIVRTLYFDDSILARFFGKSSNYTEIPGDLYGRFNVKKGLRNEDGTGVLVGLTRVSDVVGYVKDKDGKVTPCDGDLLYRGYSIHDLINNRQGNFGFEETCFLLLFGYLPDEKQLNNFKGCLADRYALPDNFLINEILGSPSLNLMNRLQTLTLQLYNYDDTPDDTDVYETLRKGLNIIAKLPYLACYAYQAKLHKAYHDSLIIHYPKKEYSIAENILQMLRPDGRFTKKEANLLDALLVIHADHGGGNNSTFTDVVVGSTGTDLYSAICASLGALKGPKHGGANISVHKMMEDVIASTGYTQDKSKLKKIVNDILDKKFYDRSGLIYGFGHAVYTLSDPRAELLRDLCQKLATDNGMITKFNFYRLFEDTVREVLVERKKKTLPTNVDFYSGLAYSMLGIPEELFTPLFAIARVSGWVAHNIENKLYDGRIMRPATKYVGNVNEYVDMKLRP
ncbi:citrate synthase [Oribacterium sp. WCC10]|uniref:citrate synthase n=1 Tax=Oribacterium sp. WCC10 TaxID=1855343 RepID=UPI0008E77F6A|nr:citrate synthase [Oribacterium sp. WCC10]SFG43048.1 citrate synthase [Oribacterium sp. WCC10]